MNGIDPVVIDQTNIIWVGLIILLAFLLVLAMFIVGAWIKRHEVALSPYTGLPLRKGENLPFEGKKKILQFLFNRYEYDNRIFELKRSGICRDTGRIFPNCVTWYGTMHIDWTFLQKRHPGHYVSWGSLTDGQQIHLRDSHLSLEKFQTAVSSPEPAPRAITPEFAFAKPGPLYVDLDTKILLGWQCVPDTEFEVLILQKPRELRNSS